MNKSLFKIDLQRFAEDDEVKETSDNEPEENLDEEIEVDTDDIEIDLDDFDNDDSIEPDEVKEESKKKPSEDEINSNLNKALKSERAERKKLQDKVKEMERLLEESKQPPKDEFEDVFNDYVNKGYDEELAKQLTDIKRGQDETRKLLYKQQRDLEIKELKLDPFYSDVDEKRNEVESLANNAGISVKQAYNALFGESKYTSNKADLRIQIEQEILNNLQKKQGLKVDMTSNGEVKQQIRTKLSSDELEIAKLAGMTPQEYEAMKKIKTTEGFKKFNAKKGR